MKNNKEFLELRRALNKAACKVYDYIDKIPEHAHMAEPLYLGITDAALNFEIWFEDNAEKGCAAFQEEYTNILSKFERKMTDELYELKEGFFDRYAGLKK